MFALEIILKGLSIPERTKVFSLVIKESRTRVVRTYYFQKYETATFSFIKTSKTSKIPQSLPPKSYIGRIPMLRLEKEMNMYKVVTLIFRLTAIFP